MPASEALIAADSTRLRHHDEVLPSGASHRVSWAVGPMGGSPMGSEDEPKAMGRTAQGERGHWYTSGYMRRCDRSVAMSVESCVFDSLLFLVKWFNPSVGCSVWSVPLSPKVPVGRCAVERPNGQVSLSCSTYIDQIFAATSERGLNPEMN